MPASFLFPTISSLPAGYDCTVVLPAGALSGHLVDGTGDVEAVFRVLFEGQVEAEEKRPLSFSGGRPTGGDHGAFVWRDAAERWRGGTGYLEVQFNALNGAPIFTSRRVLSFYAIYSKPGKKSFFSDNAYKFGAPAVINQIARFGRYVDGYPVVHLDRDRDLGETVTLINPYRRPVVVSISTHDSRRLERIRVPPMSARSVRLIDLLRADEREWFGHIQITASNRIITYNIKHSLADPTVISDHEHLDPYRAEPTHVPATQLARIQLGEWLRLSDPVL